MVGKVLIQSHFSPPKEENKQTEEEEEIIRSLPKERTWDGTFLQQYQGFWYPVRAPPEAIIAFQNHFKAHDSDILLLTSPKSGTTWMKALIFSILNREKTPSTLSPLLTSSPHDLVPFLEFEIYLQNPTFDLENNGKRSDNPRIFATHVPYVSLPSSIMDSKCRVVYLCRNPLDQFISHWHFIVNYMAKVNEADSIGGPMTSIEEGFDQFCRGIDTFGPYWDHVLCHWKLSLEKPEKLLFMKYEDLKKETGTNLRKIADFLGYPLTNEEIEKGIVEETKSLCSFGTLKNLDVNKKGRRPFGLENGALFRKGQVRDWTNYITPSMAERVEKLMEEKFGDSGLTFDLR